MVLSEEGRRTRPLLLLLPLPPPLSGLVGGGVGAGLDEPLVDAVWLEMEVEAGGGVRW